MIAIRTDDQYTKMKLFDSIDAAAFATAEEAAKHLAQRIEDCKRQHGAAKIQTTGGTKPRIEILIP